MFNNPLENDDLIRNAEIFVSNLGKKPQGPLTIHTEIPYTSN
jgi:hypothetical protein